MGPETPPAENHHFKKKSATKIKLLTFESNDLGELPSLKYMLRHVRTSLRTRPHPEDSLAREQNLNERSFLDAFRSKSKLLNGTC